MPDQPQLGPVQKSPEEALKELIVRAQGQMQPTEPELPSTLEPPAQQAVRKPSFLRGLLTNFLSTLAEDLSSGAVAQAVGEGVRERKKGQAFGTTLARIPALREEKRQRKAMEARQVVMDRIAMEQAELAKKREARMERTASQSNERLLAAQGQKIDESGKIVRMRPEEMPPALQAKLQRQDALDELTAAQEELTRARTEAIKAGLDPNSAIFKQRIKEAEARMAIASQRLQVSIRGQDISRELGQARIAVTQTRSLAKSFGSMQEAKTNVNMMRRSLDAINAGAPPGPHDMLILSRHLAMTLGMVKGARLGRDLIEHHLKARSAPEGMLRTMQGVLRGDQLSPEQREEFVKLAEDRLAEEERQFETMEGFFGARSNNAAPQGKWNPRTGRYE